MSDNDEENEDEDEDAAAVADDEDDVVRTLSISCCSFHFQMSFRMFHSVSVITGTIQSVRIEKSIIHFN